MAEGLDCRQDEEVMSLTDGLMVRDVLCAGISTIAPYGRLKKSVPERCCA